MAENNTVEFFQGTQLEYDSLEEKDTAFYVTDENVYLGDRQLNNDAVEVGNGTITIKQNGVDKGNFSLNQDNDVIVELTDEDTTYEKATTTSDGLMSKEDKGKIDAIDGTADSEKNVASAVKISKSTSDSTGESKGGANQPVYLSDGLFQPTTHSLNATVPENAKFTDTTYSNATTTAPGLMSKEDKVKLDGIAAGAQVNVAPGNGIVTVTQNGASKGSFTMNQNTNTSIDLTDTTYADATTSAHGLMTAADKTKLNGIADGAQVNSVTGVKGDKESAYRTGQINLTPENIGALGVSESVGLWKKWDHSLNFFAKKGWYRVAKGNTSCIISIKRGFNFNWSEEHQVILLQAHDEAEFKSVYNKIHSEETNIIKKIRKVRASNREYFVDIYYNSTSSESIIITMLDSRNANGINYTLFNTPQLVSETNENEAVIDELNFDYISWIPDKVSKTGDTIEGVLSFSPGIAAIDFYPNSTGGNAKGFNFLNSGVNTRTFNGGIGGMYNAGELNYIYLSVGAEDPWNSNKGLVITTSDLKWKNISLTNYSITTVAQPSVNITFTGYKQWSFTLIKIYKTVQVHTNISGSMNPVSGMTDFITIPEGYRPKISILRNYIAQNGTPMLIELDNDGKVKLYNSNNTLTDIRFLGQFFTYFTA